MNISMHFMHPPESYKLDEGIMLIFVSEKNQPLFWRRVYVMNRNVKIHDIHLWLPSSTRPYDDTGSQLLKL